MTQPTFEQQLTALIPQSIDEVVRAHRDEAEIRFSTDADLAPLAASITPTVPPTPISQWNFVTFDVHAPFGTSRHTRLFGWHTLVNKSFHSSAIVRLDLAEGLVVTAKGSLYRLDGPGGNPGDLDLFYVCHYMHKTALGGYFGVLPVFY